MTDAEIIDLYEQWSEETYCAGFMTPSTGSVAEFREWLKGPDAKPRAWTRETGTDYELEMLIEYRKQEHHDMELKNHD